MNTFQSTRQTKLTAALLSTVITVLVVSSIVIGLTGMPDGMKAAQQISQPGAAPAAQA